MEEMEEELPFDDSKIATYSSSINSSSDTTTTTISRPNTIETQRQSEFMTLSRLVEITSEPLEDPYLSRVYSMSFSNDASMIVAAGHGGRVSVFSALKSAASNNEEEQDDRILMSFKAHSGWISTAQFLNEPHILLTASNDSTLTLWDLSKENFKGTPKSLHTHTQLHRTGIFSAHCIGNRVSTASKDKTVVYSEISSQSGIRVIRRFDESHDKVVKCVAMRDLNVLASTGNDRAVVVYDARSSKKDGIVAVKEDTHPYAVNHVAFSPRDESELISASFDNVIRVWDLRKFSEPRLELRGHARFGNDIRGKSIYHPIYVSHGRYIVTPGEKSGGLSTFDAITGNLLSRCFVSIGEVTSISSCDVYGSRLCASRSSKIVLMDPVWSNTRS